jgi:hypothetical protein
MPHPHRHPLAGLLCTLAIIVCSCASNDAPPVTQPIAPVYTVPSPSPTAPAAAQVAPAPGIAPVPETAAPTDGDWPRVFVSGSTTNTIYQPQVDSWDGTTLSARNAVAIQSPDHPQPVYGVIHVQATTLVNKTDRLVDLENVRILSADFPAAPNQGQVYLAVLRQEFPKQFRSVALDRLETSLAVTRQQQKAGVQPLDNTPPQFIFATRPSILVSIDGEPTFQTVPGTGLQRVVNTRVLLLKDPTTSAFYLHVLNGYMTAPSLQGPWTVAAPPVGAAEAEEQARSSRAVDLLEGQPTPGTQTPPALTAATAPDVYAVTAPAELITFNGQPDFAPIPGTQLLCAANTTANVFKLLTDQQTYLLASGRWYRAPGLEGPWQFIPAAQLPRDFAQIPDSSSKENVKASVPDTPQAQEAVIANSIPQRARVPRSTSIQTIHIDGPAQLAPVPGTPLFYVRNSDTPVIKVHDQSWYACQNGIWFAAPSLDGPWAVADAVPREIYAIPPSSPIYYVTSVRIYNATPDYVYEGYTPGYLGTVVAPDNVVVYGTGYYYTPWVGTAWYGAPVTWGAGCDLAWTPWYGWCFGFGFGWYYGPYHRHPYWAWHPPAPWWGPYRHWASHGWARGPAWGPGGWAHTGVNFYTPPAPRSDPARYNAFGASRWHGVYGTAYNSRTGALEAGQRARVRNVFKTAPIPARTAARGQFVPASRPDTLRGNNAFATRDGGVYLQGNRQTSAWRPATPSAPRAIPRSTFSGLQRESTARALGAQRFNSFHDSATTMRGISPGGIGRGGGTGGPGLGGIGAGRGAGGFHGGVPGFGGGGFHGGGGGGFGGGHGGGGGHR